VIPYFPAEGGQYRPSLGLKVLQPADWIEIDSNFAAEIAEKKHLLDVNRNGVFLALPDSEAGQAELIETLSAHLLAHHADRYSPTSEGLRVAATGETVQPDPARPLTAAASLVQEDVLLLQPSPEGHRLVAGLLGFPTRWRLADKMGKALAGIHEPVPGYADRLSRQMDRLFAGLTPDRLLWRLNFSLLDDPALHQPGGHNDPNAGRGLNADNIGDELWFRVERQTLRLLPKTETTVFTVRIHQARLRDVVTTPERARDLAAAIDGMSEGMRRYKSIPGFEAPLKAWLAGVADS
jgi:hypothetical protein